MADWSPGACVGCGDGSGGGGGEPGEPVPGIDIEFSDYLCDLDADGEVLGTFQYKIVHDEDGVLVSSDPVELDGVTPYAIAGDPGPCPTTPADTAPCATCP